LTGLSASRRRGNPLHGLLLVGMAVLVAQVLSSVQDHLRSFSSPVTSSAGECMYELFENGERAGTVFANQPETIQGILRELGPSHQVKWAGCHALIPCGSTIRVVRGSSIVSIGTIPGSRLVAAGRKVDVNRADATDLASVPGIGPVTAERIVTERDRRGGFGNLEDLRQVRGIGEKKLATMAQWLRVGPVAHPWKFRSCLSHDEK
jgi:competence ComEA-like helix-hairpin-helix protein